MKVQNSPLGVVCGAPGSACIQPVRIVKAFSRRLDTGSVECSACMDKLSMSGYAAPGKAITIAAVPTRR